MKIDFDLVDPGLQRFRDERDLHYLEWFEKWKSYSCFSGAEIKLLLGGDISPFNPLSQRLAMARRLELADNLSPTNDDDVWGALRRYCERRRNEIRVR